MSAETVPVVPVSGSSPSPKVSVQEYLAMERESEVRHEYVDGEILAMAGESASHNRITRNICVRLERAFEGRDCESFIENIRVRVSPTQYRYPDISALCGVAEFDNDNPPALLNPSVIVEVLSPSTQAVDLGEKFIEYRQMPTVTDYLLVAQDQVQVIHYARQSERQWMVTISSDVSDTLSLVSLEVSLNLADLYRKIVFSSSETTSTQ